MGGLRRSKRRCCRLIGRLFIEDNDDYTSRMWLRHNQWTSDINFSASYSSLSLLFSAFFYFFSCPAPFTHWASHPRCWASLEIAGRHARFSSPALSVAALSCFACFSFFFFKEIFILYGGVRPVFPFIDCSVCNKCVRLRHILVVILFFCSFKQKFLFPSHFPFFFWFLFSLLLHIYILCACFLLLIRPEKEKKCNNNHRRHNNKIRTRKNTRACDQGGALII